MKHARKLVADARAAGAPYRKAIAAFVTSLAGLVGTAMLDGQLTQIEAIAAAGGSLVATAAVYGYRNDPS